MAMATATSTTTTTATATTSATVASTASATATAAVTSSSDTLSVELVSDEKKQRQGFAAQFSFVTPGAGEDPLLLVPPSGGLVVDVAANTTRPQHAGTRRSRFFSEKKNKSAFSFLRQLTTRHCSHLLLDAGRAAIDRYLVAAGPKAANPQQRRAPAE